MGGSGWFLETRKLQARSCPILVPLLKHDLRCCKTLNKGVTQFFMSFKVNEGSYLGNLDLSLNVSKQNSLHTI